VQWNWSGKDWHIAVTSAEINLRFRARTHLIPSADFPNSRLKVRRVLRYRLHKDGERLWPLRRLQKTEAAEIKRVFNLIPYLKEVGHVLDWVNELNLVIQDAERIGRWIPRNTVDDFLYRQPQEAVFNSLSQRTPWRYLTEDERTVISLASQTDVRFEIDEANSRILKSELHRRSNFFDSVEGSPLTQEQATAVVAVDNAVNLIAAAGSGKTSVMVARAAYVISRSFASPERVLMLAFNKAAAEEMRSRLESRLSRLGIDPSAIKVSTFHAFGLQLLARLSGIKPRVAPWVADGQEVGKILHLAKERMQADPSFRRNWEAYRFLFARSSIESADQGVPDQYVPAAKYNERQRFTTFRGEYVKSEGERMIADYLFINGVNYEYERPFDVKTATVDHSQYHPDFYYPEINTWHEHWALDGNGNAPESFHRYKASMAWKRDLHKKHQKDLIETTWHEVVFGTGLGSLKRKLEQRGLKFNWDTSRIQDDPRCPSDEEVAGLIRNFMIHVKANLLNPEQIEERLKVDAVMLDCNPVRTFLEIFWPIFDMWQAELAANDYIDFEDMLSESVRALEATKIDLGFSHILVDEFQDSSTVRARLLRQLVNSTNSYLLTVGDDWQSINRFAGSDISVMTDFDSYFGSSLQLQLTKTFRLTPTTSCVASRFIQKNPSQIRKAVRSSKTRDGSPIHLVTVADSGSDEDWLLAIEVLLRDISQEASLNSNDRTASVLVLGRYRHQTKWIPTTHPSNLNIDFRTIHSSKGLEADFVIVVGLTDGSYGFPSQILDPPVLQLAMAKADVYPHAEERRLLYVALTRARTGLFLIASESHPSPFIGELLRSSPGHFAFSTTANPNMVAQHCTKCGTGMLVERQGPRGLFLGCSRFPACINTEPKPQPDKT
jgi:DNA helicase-4